MNIFQQKDIATTYDEYYNTTLGKTVDIEEKQIITELLKNIPTGTLLDIGCGTGHWSALCINHGFKVTGIDSSEAMLTIAKEKQLDAHFELANAEKLPFNDNNFDAMLTVTALEFVDNQKKAIAEMHRVLKPGGWLIVGGLSADSVIGKNQANDAVFKHATLYNPNELETKFEPFKIFETKPGVHINNNYEIVAPGNLAEPTFLGIKLQKQ